jgi:ABC-type transport system substrate-binding protein
MNPAAFIANPSNPIYRYDPDKAVKLLAECGYKNRNAEGWLVMRKGEPQVLELAYDSKGFERIHTIYQEDLKTSASSWI